MTKFFYLSPGDKAKFAKYMWLNLMTWVWKYCNVIEQITWIHVYVYIYIYRLCLVWLSRFGFFGDLLFFISVWFFMFLRFLFVISIGLLILSSRTGHLQFLETLRHLCVCTQNIAVHLFSIFYFVQWPTNLKSKLRYILILNCITNNCIWHTCVTWQGTN